MSAKASTVAPGPLLCLDTATATARVAIVDGAGTVLARAEATAERHSGHVLRLCDEVLRAAGLAPADLGGLACGAGPGSFTGLRVGLAVVKGLALATGKPLLLVSSLRALALDLARAATPRLAGAWTAVPCIDAGKGEVYALACAVDASGTVAPASGSDDADRAPWRLTPQALAVRLVGLPGVVVAGNGAERHAATLDGALPPGGRRASVDGPTALAIAALAWPRFARGEADDLDKSVPLYGRPPDITTKKTPASR
jgi:tRNA threonylcarbamoyladenosine biosynthesis protein TsaB